MTALEHCWKNCVVLNGDYVEKKMQINKKSVGLLYRPRTSHPTLIRDSYPRMASCVSLIGYRSPYEYEIGTTVVGLTPL